jgi:hypothetical protein
MKLHGELTGLNCLLTVLPAAAPGIALVLGLNLNAGATTTSTLNDSYIAYYARLPERIDEHFCHIL